MAPIFSNECLDGRQLGDLMAARIADVIAGAQRALTMTTGVGDQVDDRVDALSGHHGARVARMSRLTAGLAAALLAATSFALASCEPVGRRGLRGCGRVLLVQCQLPFEIGDAFRLLRNLPLAFGELPSQALDLSFQALFGVRALLSLGPRHASHSTPIGSICTAP